MPGVCDEIIDDIEDLISSQDITPKERYSSRKNVSVRFKKREIKNDYEPTEKVILESVVPGTQTIYVKTWGCAHNNSDSEYMAGLLAANGYKLTENKFEAQLWLLNSCTVKSPAEDHFKNEIELGQSRGIHIVVAGCVPQGAPRANYLTGLSVVGVQQIDRIVEIVEETLKANSRMSTYNQPVKRQKTKETQQNVEYFQSIDKIEFNNMASPSETATYRYYNSSERVHSRTMEEWLKYSIALTEFRNYACNPKNRPSYARSWDDGTTTIDNYKRSIKALFELCSKLGVKYWTAFDSDLIPWSDNWDENKTHWEDVVEYIQELTQRYHIKLLWIAPDLHSHPRYTSGAFTSNEATTFIQAAAQIKRCLEFCQRLNAECFLLWPFREGYNALFETDVTREIKLFAKLLKLTAEHKDKLNYRCQLLIMPYYNFHHIRNNNYGSWQHSQWRESDMIHTYMWDVTSCLYLLKNYNLERYYKISVMPGHHMYMANVYNMLGGVTITNEFNHYDSKSLTLMMKCIVDQGTVPFGGINLKLYPRRDSDLRELVTSYTKYIDAIAKALRLACSIISEQVISKHIQQRYGSYYSGFGSRIIGDVSMEECEEYYKKNHSAHVEMTSKHEHLDVIFQRHLDTCDNI